MAMIVAKKRGRVILISRHSQRKVLSYRMQNSMVLNNLALIRTLAHIQFKWIFRPFFSCYLIA